MFEGGTVDIYVELRDKLDKLGIGYTPTEAGEEMFFLHRFFTPKQAKYFILMNDDVYETAAELAEVVGEPVEDVEKELYQMSAEGLIFRRDLGDGAYDYHTVPFVHGMFEFKLKEVDTEWTRHMEKHYMGGWGRQFNGTDYAICRTVPIKAELVADHKILPVDDLQTIVEGRRRWGVCDCICRLKLKAKGKECHHEMESCLVFDDFADYYLDNGWAREITCEEALDIIWKGEKDGRVASVSNAKDVDAICTCCTCACGLLGALKYFPGPANKKDSNYHAVHDADKCLDKCNHVCTRRCPMGAFKVVDDKLVFNVDKCIGCGLCVSTCPGKAIQLVRKPDEEIYTPLETIWDTYEAMSIQRGKKEAKEA